MPPSKVDASTGAAMTQALGMFAPAAEYLVDAAQRSLLFCDVMRQRGNQYREHLTEAVPHVLDYEVELVMDGRTLERPVNYGLVRVSASGGRRHRSDAPAVRHRRSARRTWAGHRRLQGRQRNRRCLQGRACLLFHRLHAGSRAGTDDRGYRARRGGLSRAGHRPASPGRRKALRHWQLPGGLGDHDAGRHPSRTVRSDHRRGIAVVVLGRRARQESDAL